ncbi:MAG: M48 family metallopeptidase [Phycisphaerales bacterium]|nr:M48 family metallopeptidase [Phycisphaerales bacterium]
MSIPRCAFLASMLTIVAMTGCSEVSGTGRKQLMLVSTSQEMKLGAEAYQEVLASEKLSTNTRMAAVVKRVGQRIAAVADRPDFEWEFNLIESDQVNAFCLPGGKIAVYTGILPIMKNEAGMAAVMGHEVAHAIARHGAERMSQQLSVQVLQEGLSRGLGNASPMMRKGVLGAFGIGTNVGVMLPFSRTHELEADKLGLRYCAMAGYDPREAVRLWQRMKDASSGKPPEFLSTHPSEDNRIAQLEDEMDDAMDLYEDASDQHGLGESW